MMNFTRFDFSNRKSIDAKLSVCAGQKDSRGEKVYKKEHIYSRSSSNGLSAWNGKQEIFKESQLSREKAKP